MSHIRRIAVHVDEPDPGLFYWVLMEEGDDTSQWVELESADEHYDMWLDALQAGVRALEGYAPDERIGPRASGDDEDANPVREQET
ncbi:hypothetical protein [Variovorax sp. IB41]|uniref:hypothetical protein n=1 Tax=Variovorax sp. IB41 TaxID=2779370 RepID=UPI0018E779B7|nr:hypothetical protein [Variovorax sp. IB41]MBJ2154587.1 hypothetical protein [Variovorax sp. IB41]